MIKNQEKIGWRCRQFKGKNSEPRHNLSRSLRPWSAKTTEQVFKRKQSFTLQCKVHLLNHFQTCIFSVWTGPMMQEVACCQGFTLVKSGRFKKKKPQTNLNQNEWSAYRSPAYKQGLGFFLNKLNSWVVLWFVGFFVVAGGVGVGVVCVLKEQYLERMVLMKLEPSANPGRKLHTWCKLQPAAFLFYCSPMAGTENRNGRLRNCVQMFIKPKRLRVEVSR